MAEIAANLRAVRERVDRAAGRSGRDHSAVELLVVTKTWPPEVIAEVLEAGHELLGENKLQEAWGKIPELPASARWHFIGHLQRNKARKALGLFEAIHSVDSLRLARHLDRVAGELGKRPRIYLQVNAAEEESKSGFAVGELREALPELLSLEKFELAGRSVREPRQATGRPVEVVSYCPRVIPVPPGCPGDIPEWIRQVSLHQYQNSYLI